MDGLSFSKVTQCRQRVGEYYLIGINQGSYYTERDFLGLDKEHGSSDGSRGRFRELW